MSEKKHNSTFSSKCLSVECNVSKEDGGSNYLKIWHWLFHRIEWKKIVSMEKNPISGGEIDMKTT